MGRARTSKCRPEALIANTDEKGIRSRLRPPTGPATAMKRGSFVKVPENQLLVAQTENDSNIDLNSTSKQLPTNLVFRPNS